MENLSKRIIACFLAALMIFTALPFMSFAAESTHTHNFIYAQGKVKVSVDSKGTFTVGKEVYKCDSCSVAQEKETNLSVKLTNVAKEAGALLESPECRTDSAEYVALKSAYNAIEKLTSTTHYEKFIEARIADAEAATTALKKAAADNGKKNEIVKSFTVKFVVRDENGTEYVAKKQSILYGGKATAPSVAAYSNETTHYTFKKWDVSFENVKSNLTVTAVYEGKAHSFDKVVKAAKAATCTEDGNTEERACSCGYTTGGAVVNALGHKWSEPETTHGTTEMINKKCTRTGCNATYSEHAKYNEHKLVKHAAKAPTCTEPGYKEYSTCETCDYSTRDVDLPAKGHVPGLNAGKAATCTSTGLTAGKYCITCREILVPQKTLKELGHDYTEKIVDDNHRKSIATCDSAAVYYYDCSRCNSKSSTETFTDGKAAGHKFTAKLIDDARRVSAATCESPAVYYYSCETCKAISKADTFTSGSALGHDWSEAVANADGKTETKKCKRAGCTATETLCKGAHTFETKAAKLKTCTEDGWNEYKLCTVCGYKEGYTVIPAGHTEGHGETYIARLATCFDDGEQVTVTYCANKNCGKIVNSTSTPIEAVGAHKFETKPNGDGTQTKTCTACGIEVIECVGGKHTAEVFPGKDPTCTEDGLTDGERCSACGEIITERLVISALGHKEEELKAVAATCTEDGLTAGKKCTVCGEITVKQEVVPKKGHTEVEIPAVEATCTSTGLTAGKKCSVCGEITVKQEETPKKNHTEVEIPAVAATCTEGGFTAGKKCSVCNEIIEAPQKTEALGHEPIIDVEALPMTCLADGRTEGYHCARCDYKVESQVIKAPGKHTEEVVEAAEPTCTKDGTTEGIRCSVCGDVLKGAEVIKATGHKFGTAVKKATTSADGSIVKTCSVCGETEKSVIAKVSNVSLAKSRFNYNGKKQTPVVIVKDSKGVALKNKTDYVLTYSNNLKAGKATVTVTFTGSNYEGKKVLTFDIVPNAPAKVSAKQTSTSIKVSWSEVKTATNYRVQLFNKNNKLVRTITTNKLSVNIKKLANGKPLAKGTKYKVVVTAYVLANGKAVYGDSKALSTATKPAAVTGVKAAAGNKSIVVKWNGKVYGATGYTVYYSTKKNGNYKAVVVGAKKNRVTVKNLKRGTYYVKVAANKRLDNKTVIRSIPSKVQTVTVK